MFSALAANVKFTAVQSMQGIAALTAYLHLLDADMVRLGIKPKTTAIPIEVAFREMFAGFKGESRYFMDYAAKNHITDTALWEIFQRDSLVKSSLHQGINKLIDTLTLRWPAEKLETFNRGFAFLAGAKYARANGFSLEASLRFGNKMTDVIMGNYSKGSRPLFYTNYGAAGHLFSPFSTIMNQYLGNMMHQGININGGKGTRAALVSAGAMGLSYLIFSGLQGLPGIEDYDKVVRFLNGKNINPDEVHFPSWNDVLSDHEIHPAIQYGVPTWVTMLVSEAAGGAPGQGGMNIGSGANAPGISGRFDATTLGASADQALFAWEALKQAYVLLGGSKEHTPNQDTLYKSMKRVAPAPFKALIESQYSYKKGTMPSAQKLDDNLPASTEDWIARFAGGRTPVQQDYINNMNVAESREHERIVNIKNATINISDKMFNPSVPPEIVTKLITEAATKYSADVGTIEKTAMQYHINRNINWREKFILRNSSGSLGGAINISNMPKGVQ